jgi:S-phase kinase-associated protein 1
MATEEKTATEEGRTVHLVSQEGDSFDVQTSVANMSELVKTMIDDEAEADAEPQEIPLPNVKGNVLAKVIEFCNHYKEDPMSDIEKPLKSANMHEVVQDWYANFVHVRGGRDFDAKSGRDGC